MHIDILYIYRRTLIKQEYIHIIRCYDNHKYVFSFSLVSILMPLRSMIIAKNRNQVKMIQQVVITVNTVLYTIAIVVSNF